MRRLLRPLLIPMLRRAPDEVEQAGRHFSVTSQGGRDLVAGVGRAFLGGYHAMLESKTLGEVRAHGLAVDSRFRPFFFEGAAMGYLPRSYFTPGTGRHRVEADLLAMDERFLYLYYVGLGFWFGFRHPGRPDALEDLAAHLDPFYVPLCYDGFGFKLGFFDHPKRNDVASILERAPESRRAAIYQGFGRALFFVCMDDAARFAGLLSRAPADRRGDLTAGRSLALAFTGIAEPAAIAAHLAGAPDEEERGHRLLGVTWALAAREMNDPPYFEDCLRGLPPSPQSLLHRLPRECREAKESSVTYEEWRMKTLERVRSAYAVTASAASA